MPRTTRTTKPATKTAAPGGPALVIAVGQLEHERARVFAQLAALADEAARLARGDETMRTIAALLEQADAQAWLATSDDAPRRPSRSAAVRLEHQRACHVSDLLGCLAELSDHVFAIEEDGYGQQRHQHPALAEAEQGRAQRIERARKCVAWAERAAVGLADDLPGYPKAGAPSRATSTPPPLRGAPCAPWRFSSRRQAMADDRDLAPPLACPAGGDCPVIPSTPEKDAPASAATERAQDGMESPMSEKPTQAAQKRKKASKGVAHAHKQPGVTNVPWYRFTEGEARSAAAVIEGFDRFAVSSNMARWLEENPNAAPNKIAVAEHLSRAACQTLYSDERIGNLRWSLAHRAFIDRVECALSEWKKAADLRKQELTFLASRSTPRWRPRYELRARAIDEAAGSAIATLRAFMALEHEPPEGGVAYRFERWACLLREASFSYAEIVALFRPDDDLPCLHELPRLTAEAVRKRCKQHLSEPENAERVKMWLAEILAEAQEASGNPGGGGIAGHRRIRPPPDSPVASEPIVP